MKNVKINGVEISKITSVSIEDVSDERNCLLLQRINDKCWKATRYSCCQHVDTEVNIITEKQAISIIMKEKFAWQDVKLEVETNMAHSWFYENSRIAAENAAFEMGLI